MLNMIKEHYHNILRYDPEMVQLMEYVHSLLMVNKNARILDVGCGYGRYLKPLQKTGYDVTGVEENIGIVESNCAQGLKCMSVDEFTQSNMNFDVILMSHIIEHFSPSALKEFMDGYLDRLEMGGHLIIATPLLSPYFYDDFDHVKPYQPIGILMVFGGSGAQVQYYARNKLDLKDVWFRKSFYRLSFVKSKYQKSGVMTRLFQFITFLSALASYLSRGTFGKTDGWIGVFEKVDG